MTQPGDAAQSQPSIDLRPPPTLGGPAASSSSAVGHGPRWPLRLRVALTAVDLIAISLALSITYLLAFGQQSDTPLTGATMVNHQVVSVVFAVVWMVFLATCESRRVRYLGAGIEEYRRVITASLQTFGTLAILSYLLKVDVSRLLFLLALPVGLLLLLLGRWIARAILTRARRAGRAMIPTIVVGDEREVRWTVSDLIRDPGAGYRPIAVGLFGHERRGVLNGYPVLDEEAVAQYVREMPRAAVVVTGGLSREETRRLAWQMEGSGARLLFTPSLVDVAGPRIAVQEAAGMNLLHVELPSYSGAKYWLKRSFDVVFAGTALVVMAPVLAVIALVIKLGDGGPVLFRQERVGLQGNPFVLHKFRTMHVDAESRLEELRAHSISDSPLFKMDVDPRVTRVGAFLRKTSLDELPQFWTVLRGQMSVVGPRPHLANELAEFPEMALRRLLTKPGITGLWQVGGRSDLALEDAIRLDLRYVENWSLAGDISIILRTVRMMFRGVGAY